MRDLPSGTLTFLFTDVEGSTRLLEEIGDEAYALVLAEHHRLCREAWSAHRGVEVETEGDAFFVVFEHAPDALAAALSAQEALASGPVRVRMGLHTGPILLTQTGYVGRELHFAARVASSGHGGQVVCSQATRLAAGESFPFSDLGEHRLKDIPQAVPIYQLGEGSFPPLKTISNTNLPRPASSFLGREHELEALLAKIEQGARLVTLTGPGGTGKTRLALEAAATLVPSYKAGVFWVGLASLRDPALVSETIAQVLGAKDGLAEHIGERELLLLLDNLEQVVEAAPELSSLLQGCPNLALLVTSRELLRVQGEVEYQVPPLQEPEAVSLFCERSELEANDEIAELCRRLDSLPLAVELAAARTKALSPKQILERLSQRLDLLKGGRDADPRQQTLRATIEWSYDLLSEEEQRVFRALSVFAGGCTLEAAEEVCGADLDTLQSLVEKSILRFTNERYWMLETIREYAEERLKETGARDELRGRHAGYVLGLAVEAAEAPSDDIRWLNTLEFEQDNVRAAFAWLGQTGRIGEQLDLVSVTRFWGPRGLWVEGLRLCEAALAGSEGELSARRARAFELAGLFAWSLGSWDRARSYFADALSISRELHDDSQIATALTNLGTLEMNTGNLTEAERRLGEAADCARRTGDRTSLASVTGNLAALAAHSGDDARAIPLYEEAIAIFRELERPFFLAAFLADLSETFERCDRDAEAVQCAQEALGLAHRLGDSELLIRSFLALGSVLAKRGEADLAATLRGATDAVRKRMAFADPDDSHHRRLEEELRRTLGQERYESALASGQAMVLEDAVQFARASTENPPASPSRPSLP